MIDINNLSDEDIKNIIKEMDKDRRACFVSSLGKSFILGFPSSKIYSKKEQDPYIRSFIDIFRNNLNNIEFREKVISAISRINLNN